MTSRTSKARGVEKVVYAPSVLIWNGTAPPVPERARSIAELDRLGKARFNGDTLKLFVGFVGELNKTPYLYNCDNTVTTIVQGMKYQPDALQALREACVEAGVPMPLLHVAGAMVKTHAYAAMLSESQSQTYS